MQKIVLCALALVAVVATAPQDQHPTAPQDQYPTAPQDQHPTAPQDQHPTYILKQESNVSPDGYHFQFETSDGTSRHEQGSLKQISEDHHAIEVQGAYSYTAPDGLVYSVTYIADEHGFQPQEHVSHPGQAQ